MRKSNRLSRSIRWEPPCFATIIPPSPQKCKLLATRNPLQQILYRQIYHTLKAEIQNGHYPPGSQLPTEAALIQRFGVSRVTVRNALALLQQEGFVVRIPAKGTFVQAE